MPLPHNAKNKPLALHMRKNLTKQEKHLWYDFLSKHPLRFRRQVMIDNYIVDFYSHHAKLVIEVDGSQHETDEGIMKDEIRTEKLEKYDLLVLRIPNRCIDKDFHRVCDYINQVIKERMRGR